MLFLPTPSRSAYPQLCSAQIFDPDSVSAMSNSEFIFPQEIVDQVVDEISSLGSKKTTLPCCLVRSLLPPPGAIIHIPHHRPYSSQATRLGHFLRNFASLAYHKIPCSKNLLREYLQRPSASKYPPFANSQNSTLLFPYSPVCKHFTSTSTDRITGTTGGVF